MKKLLFLFFILKLPVKFWKSLDPIQKIGLLAVTGGMLGFFFSQKIISDGGDPEMALICVSFLIGGGLSCLTFGEILLPAEKEKKEEEGDSKEEGD